MPKKIIRHEIKPALIKKSVKTQISRYKKLKAAQKKEAAQNFEERNKNTAKPKTLKETLQEIEDIYNSFIEKEKTVYSLVRIIENPKQEGERFYLVYGDSKDAPQGTGPFISLEKAQAWFLGQGR